MHVDYFIWPFPVELFCQSFESSLPGSENDALDTRLIKFYHILFHILPPLSTFMVSGVRPYVPCPRSPQRASMANPNLMFTVLLGSHIRLPLYIYHPHSSLALLKFHVCTALPRWLLSLHAIYPSLLVPHLWATSVSLMFTVL